jgi:hypothetical protein
MDPRTTARYSIGKPAATHRRDATCLEVGCKYLREGWQMHVMDGTPMGERQAYLIRESGRRYSTAPEPAGTLYTFEPGQRCFGKHTVPIDRPAIYLVRQGAGLKRHVNPLDWVDDFSTHLDKIREQ